MATQKSKRSVTLKRRAATVSNFNFQPEKKGKDELGQLRIHQDAVMSFDGLGITAKDKNQKELEV